MTTRQSKLALPDGTGGCPVCNVSLRPSCDMWGPFWYCEDCGYSAETTATPADSPASRLSGRDAEQQPQLLAVAKR